MKNNKELLNLIQLEDGSFSLVSNYIGLFGYIELTQSGTYYVYFPVYDGFLKAKHLIFITQKLNELNKYDEFKEKMKHGL